MSLTEKRLLELSQKKAAAAGAAATAALSTRTAASASGLNGNASTSMAGSSTAATNNSNNSNVAGQPHSSGYYFKPRNYNSMLSAAGSDYTNSGSCTETNSNYSSSDESLDTPHHKPAKGKKVGGAGGAGGAAKGKKNVTISYTYDAFFISDGRSRKRNALSESGEVSSNDGGKERQRYTCTECGKHYATSSNLSRHKQTHRSPDSQLAKKCPTCNKVYVSMPALAMHVVSILIIKRVIHN